MPVKLVRLFPGLLILSQAEAGNHVVHAAPFFGPSGFQVPINTFNQASPHHSLKCIASRRHQKLHIL